MRRQSVVSLDALAALVMVAGLACSLDRAPRPDGTSARQSVLGVSGGELVLQNGARLDIPAGAFDGTIELAFEIVDAPPETQPPLPDTFSAIGSMYVIKPHGMTFDKTVELSVPAMGRTADELIMLTLADDDDDEWNLVSEPVTVSGDAAIVPLSHLSYYQLALRPKPDGQDPTVPDLVTGVCGDGMRDVGEACDDGDNDGRYGGCMPGCKSLGPRCGDDTVSTDEGETCDGNCVSEASCVSTNACVMPMFAGAANTCDAVCDLMTIIQTCGLNDGCCPANCVFPDDQDCSDTCGNGTVEGNETCEPSLGDCPVSCEDNDPCTADMLTGSDCNQDCANTPITMPIDGDGCCPSGQNAGTDTDCMPRCGDGHLDAGEVCDDGVNDGTYGGCNPDCLSLAAYCGDGTIDSAEGETCESSCDTQASCDSIDACLVHALVGDAAQCNARCQYMAEISACMDADGCCPSGCGPGTDDDCSPSCGNGTVESNEDCDTAISSGTGVCPVTPADCDDGDPCTDQVVTGSGCNSRCANPPTQPDPASPDQCCPNGANASTDADCLCGNGVVDAGEVCDDGINDGRYNGCRPGCQQRAASYCGNGQVDTNNETCDGNCPAPGACTSANSCVVPMYSGGPSTCDADCDLSTVINVCAHGDGCCPGQCHANNDDDCMAECGNGVVEAGEMCDDGVNNGSYNGCMPGCQAFGPYCGDGTTNGSEVCDDGVNNGSYNGCAPGCQALGPYCGDSITQRSDGEVCDDGVNDGSYEGCMTNCRTLAPYCGDLMKNGPELCDGNCTDPSACVPDQSKLASYTGDPSTCDGVCTITEITSCVTGDGCCPSGCTNASDLDCGGVCGDGIKDPGEFCDDGTGANGQPGKCNLSCTDIVRTYAELHAEFIETKCASMGGCHNQSMAGRLGLLDNSSDANLVKVDSACNPGFQRVLPTMPEEGVFMSKLDPALTAPPNCEDTMHSSLLDDDQRQMLRDWIWSL